MELSGMVWKNSKCQSLSHTVHVHVHCTVMKKNHQNSPQNMNVCHLGRHYYKKLKKNRKKTNQLQD